MHYRRGLIAAVLVMAASSSCGGGPTGPIDRETFESVMVSLRKAGLETDSAGFDARREEILRTAGVTDSVLLAFVRAHAGDVAYMAEVWESIDVQLNDQPQDPEEGLDTLSHR